MIELFEIEPCLSPRLKWIDKHGLNTAHCDEELLLEPSTPWIAYVGTWTIEKPWDESQLKSDFGFGASEEEAIIDWAIRHKIKLWNE